MSGGSAVGVLALGSMTLNTEMTQSQSFQGPVGCLQLAYPRLTDPDSYPPDWVAQLAGTHGQLSWEGRLSRNGD